MERYRDCDIDIQFDVISELLLSSSSSDYLYKLGSILFLDQGQLSTKEPQDV